MPRLSIRLEQQQGLFVASAGEPDLPRLFGFGLTEDDAVSDLALALARSGCFEGVAGRPGADAAAEA